MKRFGMQLCATLVSVAFAAALLAQAPAKNGSAKKNGGAPPAAEAERGKVTFEKRCAICHYAASDAKKIGPGLKGISKRATYDSDGKPVNDASLRAWIENGGKSMPGFKAVLNADQVRDLLSYLRAL